jgi:hypothetical protein
MRNKTLLTLPTCPPICLLAADDDPVVSCPISVSLGYLKGVLPDGVAAAWIGAIVRRAAQLYMSRLLALAARQEQREEFEGEMSQLTG